MTGATSYRLLLRCYPRGWREEVLGTALEAAAAQGRTRPTVAEAADLVAHGLLARAGRTTADLVALLAFASVTALAVLGAAYGEQGTRWSHPTYGGLVQAGWLLAALLVVLGRPGAARRAGLATVLVTAALPFLDPRPPLHVIALYGGFGLLALPVRVTRRATFAALAAGIAGPSWWAIRSDGGGGLPDLAWYVPFGVGAVGLVALGTARWDRSLLAASLVVGTPWLLYAWYAGPTGPGVVTPVVAGAVAMTAVVVAGVVVGRDSARDERPGAAGVLAAQQSRAAAGHDDR